MERWDLKSSFGPFCHWEFVLKIKFFAEIPSEDLNNNFEQKND